MVSNQNEFNNTHPKGTKKIEIRRNRNFQGDLFIENYLELEILNLRDIRNIDKVVFKNLPQLQECTIWNCGLTDLVIENCPQIKKLNIRSNLLTNLNFLQSLPNLENLEIDGNTELASGLEHLPKSLKTFSFENTKLTEVLKFCQGNWKAYRESIQEITDLTSHQPQELLRRIWDLKQENRKLQEKQPVAIDSPDNFQKKYQKLKEKLKFLLEKEQIKTEELSLLEEKSKEINLVEEENNITTTDLLKKIKEDKNDLFNLKKTNQKLKKQLSSFEQLYFAKKQELEQKEKELEELTTSCLEKSKSYKKVENKLSEFLECQAEIVINNSEYASKRKSEIREKLRQKGKLTIEELDNLCQLQKEITQLKLELQKKLDKVVNNYYNQGFVVSGDHADLSGAIVKDVEMKINAYREEDSDTELQATIETSLSHKYLKK